MQSNTTLKGPEAGSLLVDMTPQVIICPAGDAGQNLQEAALRSRDRDRPRAGLG